MIQSRLHQKLINILVTSLKKKKNSGNINLNYQHINKFSNLQPHIWTRDMGPIGNYQQSTTSHLDK